MTSWPSIARTPPSTLYPADGTKWIARSDIAQTLPATAFGRAISIIELRGWLRSSSSPTGDPDWHYDLELDPLWLAQLGVSPSALCRPGDLLIRSGPDPASARRRSGPASIHAELDGWQRTDLTRGQPPKPVDWTFPTATADWPFDSTTIWPFDPRVDANGKTLADAQGHYARVVGSLVTDGAHADGNKFFTNQVLWTGVGTAARAINATPGMSRKDGDALLADAANNAAKWLWIESAEADNPANPARWNELHSPDYIELMDEPADRRCLYQVAVCAAHGLFSGDTEHLKVDLMGPPGRPAGSILRYRAYPTSWTDPSTVIAGPILTAAYGHLTVDVTVQGQSGMGHSGKYAELFELWWEKALRYMTIANVAVPVDQTVSVVVRAFDASSHAEISGAVLFDGKQVGQTGTSFAHRFGTHTVWTIVRDSRNTPHRVAMQMVDPFEGVVHVDDYHDARIPFVFTGIDIPDVSGDIGDIHR